MNFKTKRRYKLLSRFFLVLFISSAVITLTRCWYSLNSKTTLTNTEMCYLIPFYIIGIIIMLISMSQHLIFLNKREDYVRSITNLRQEHWQKIVVELADNDELDKAMTLYGALNFKDHGIQKYLEGYLTALDKNKSEK